MKWALALALVLAAPALALEDPVVAEVGTDAKAVIRRSELEKECTRDGRMKLLLAAGAKEKVRELVVSALDRLIEEKALLLECDRLGIEKPEGDEARAAGIRIAALIGKQVDHDVTVSHEDARGFYDDHASDFELPPRTMLYVLATTDRTKAEEVRAKLGKNREAWAAIAEKAEMPLREIPDGELESELGPRACELAGLAPGATLVIVTPSGYAALALVERRPARTRTFEEAEDEIRAALKTAAIRERIAQYVRSLVAATPIKKKLPED